MKNKRFWLVITIIGGFGLRLLLLGEQSLWYDEGVTWMLSQMVYLSDLIEWTAADIQPPLYYLLIWHTYIIYGQTEWALRFPSVVFNTLTIPLIYVLAVRLFSGKRPASLLATLFFALSPLMIYYSQEARMYTLLVFEAVLASYLLMKIVHPRPSRVESASSPFLYSHGYPVLYALIAATALYTHYFAAFLLMTHALYLLVILWQRGWPRSLLIQAGQMFAGAGLLFVPWLPTLISRLGDDPSYWPGALKLDEAIRKVAISFVAGETVIEQTGLWLTAICLGLLLLAASFRLIERSSHSPKSASARPLTGLFLFLWLLLPPGLILALSYQSPKFNSRYTMLAWPAFALILAGLLAQLWSRQNLVSRNHSTHRDERTRQSDKEPAGVRPAQDKRIFNRVSRLLFAFTLCFILSINTYSLYNWFADPRFSKDDFQALARFVQERMAPDETVLLSSGHLFPVWAYYFGWDNWTPLPWMQRLDVSDITDLSISGQIAEAVADKEGVWLVTWQNEVIDPNGVVPFWLDLVGERPVDAGDFWGVGLEHWRLNPRRLDLLDQSAIHRAAPFNFNDHVDLLGMTQVSDVELALFWQPRQPLPDDLLLTLKLTDPDGFDWAREDFVGRPGAYLYPPSRWPIGEVVMTRHHLPWLVGTPPGLYLAEIGLGQAAQPDDGPFVANAATDFVGWDILDEQGRPQRQTALIESVNLSHLVEPESGPLPIDPNPIADFLPIVAVRRSILPQETAEPGDQVLLALLWQAGEFNADDISVAFDLVDAQNQSFRVGSSLTPSRRFNLPRWDPGDVVLGQYWLDIPAGAAPGPATLQLHLINVGVYTYDEVFTIDELEIEPTERNFTPPDSVEMPLEANFADMISLIGADCATPASGCAAKPGDSLTLTLYWQAKAVPDKNYTIFTHLLGPDETVIVNADHAPPKPTQGWVADEIIVDPVVLPLPADLSPGDYLLEVGLYDAADPTYPRLSLTNGDTRLILSRSLQVE